MLYETDKQHLINALNALRGAQREVLGPGQRDKLKEAEGEIQAVLAPLQACGCDKDHKCCEPCCCDGPNSCEQCG